MADIHWRGTLLHVLGGAGILILVAIGHVWWAASWVAAFGLYRELTKDLKVWLPDLSVMTTSKWFEALGWAIGACGFAAMSELLTGLVAQ